MRMPSRSAMRARSASIAIVGFVVFMGGSVRAAAQSPVPAPVTSESRQSTSGWALTPTIVYGGTWDDNVLIHSEGDATSGDYLTVVNPRGTLEYNGRRSQFSLNYDGAFLLYR